MTIRTQIDGLNELVSIDTGLDCSDKPDVTRQEFKAETDVNNILARYGVEGIAKREPIYSEIDYNMDLQSSLEAIREAEAAIAKLPADLYVKYPTWEQLLSGAFNGSFKADLTAYYEGQAAAKAAAEKIVLDKANPPA